jgi:hypothetical protein
MFLFEAPGNDRSKALSEPRQRAGAWAGGTITLWAKGDATAVTMSLVARADSPGPSLCDSMQAWSRAVPATSNNSARAVQCAGDTVRVSIANG